MNPNKMGQFFLTLVNAGVLLSVVLLILELRQNQEIAIAEIRNDISRQAVEREVFQASPEMAAMLVKAESGEQLNDVEIYQIRRLFNIIFQNFENIVYQYDAGMYSNEEFESVEERLGAMDQGMLNFYRTNAENYSGSFQRVMSRIHDTE